MCLLSVAQGVSEDSAQLTATGVTATYSGAINQAVSLGHARPVSLLHTPLALNFQAPKKKKKRDTACPEWTSPENRLWSKQKENFLGFKWTMDDINDDAGTFPSSRPS